MINKNEIRIGSWYQNHSSDEALKFKKVEDFEGAIYVSIYCKPIPLTEDWVLNFGFNPLQVEKHHWKHPIALELRDGEYIYSSGSYDVKLKYVHQLQNLFHALTGEELTLKEQEI